MKKRARIPKMVRRVENHSDGSRTVHLTAEGVRMFEAQRDAFREKFGRDPLPKDPVFFDEDEDAPTPITTEKLRRAFLDACRHVEIDPHDALKLWEAWSAR